MIRNLKPAKGPASEKAAGIATDEILLSMLEQLEKLNAYMALITDEDDPPQETK